MYMYAHSHVHVLCVAVLPWLVVVQALTRFAKTYDPDYPPEQVLQFRDVHDHRFDWEQHNPGDTLFTERLYNIQALFTRGRV